MWTISGNLIGSQAINIHLTSALGFSISGNYIYSGHERNIVIEASRSIVLGDNTLGHRHPSQRVVQPFLRLTMLQLSFSMLPAGNVF